jgi:diguanylate cyclase (GGDEF)-like protein/PAS domain S-box-containing protein
MTATLPLAAPKTPARRQLILIVDDVAANLHVMASALRDGYRIKTATNGRAALEIAARSDRPDLILLDVMMPAMGGHEVLRELRARPATQNIPVIFVTADTSESSELHGLELGAADFYAKPVNVPVLRTRVRNLLAQRQLQHALQLNELKLRAMLDSSMQFIGLLDTDGRIVHVNRQVHELLGVPLEALIGQNFSEIALWGDGTDGRQAQVHEAVMLARRGESSRFETRHVRADGGTTILDFSLRPVLGAHGEVAFLLPEATDVTRQRAAEENIRHLANYDPLTGLPNRTLLTDRISQAIRHAERSHEPFALMFLDLDRFKHINDTLGHACGDKLLREVAGRLEQSVRLQDTVSRLGGDEFVLLLPGTPSGGAAVVAEKLLANVAKPCLIDLHELAVTPSIGIAMYPNDGTDFTTLSKCADIAMYRAKREGRNGYRFFTQEMHERSSRMLHMETLLRHAIERGELELHYQPQTDIASGRCVGAEALLRWNSPELGRVSPAEFVPMAEETGLIAPIGAWVLRTAVRQAKAWLDAGLALRQVAVNVSPIQLRQRQLPQLVADCLREEGLPPERLELELTESAAFSNPDVAYSILRQLHGCGVHLSIDDFGTGYSSLSHLRRIHIDKLKIDQSFVRDLGRDPEDEALIEAIIAMARSLKLSVVAEGVETQAQFDTLRQLGCDQVQGYLLARPMPVAEFEAWLRQPRVSAATVA